MSIGHEWRVMTCKCFTLEITTLSEKPQGLKASYLVYISFPDNKDKLAVLLHHSAVLQDTLHLHSNLLTPGGAWDILSTEFKHLFPQQAILCMEKEENIVTKQAELVFKLLVTRNRHNELNHSCVSVTFFVL